MIFNNYYYDIIVIGGGHSGSEAAFSSSKMGAKTLLITSDINTIAKLSCNPSMGGIAKGQIIREIDALGGYSGIVTDYSSIQFRMLNKSKGPAVWSPRSQCDRMLFSYYWKYILKKNKNLSIYQDTVKSLIIKNYKVIGVETKMKIKINAHAVILTNGTFLNGVIHIGTKKISGGRINEEKVIGITEQLNKCFGLKYGRMKTGTSPRVDKNSLEINKMEFQYGDKNIGKFSFFHSFKKTNKQCKCYITYTNKEVLDAIYDNRIHSPILNNSIKGKGPRYCPSIEDKVIRFPKKVDHPIFIEPEGLNTKEMYINGFSTSFSEEIQYKILKKIPGFNKVKITQPGYAVEYDYFYPEQLTNTLESKKIKNLFFAGQINGTTGYEEAASQGLIAGINAYSKIYDKNPVIIKRNEGYIGVLIDDLVTKGIREPYRMFTSRSEYRMSLRQDNADERLSHIGYRIGLISKQNIKIVENKKNKIKKCINFFIKNYVKPIDINNILYVKKSPKICFNKKISEILLRSEISIEDIKNIPFIMIEIKKNKFNKEILDQVSIRIKYKGYLDKEIENANRLLKLENIRIPHNLNYKKINSISLEGKEKLEHNKPKSLAHASKISGISQSDLSIILIYLKKLNKIK
ncbi:tRNA uridine-5-carboxymethylaminomethyl(34) synthesis enzyme MnmG [Blattabacterium cuenoti]|uniref:tRNA uridine-5-carboxymethylaminomethyl(34) synthesis enzyme MnmG n=1 Tax=Blattabacterium cuenoti TaxID=1653831 RepID=UPI00163CA0C5|nr:tRNA uridine-5-carboxymethylaminomethyl(34) synthesis enzyme MnmG [Blattabacterium cuenoti]